MINSYITLSELFCFPHSIEFTPSKKMHDFFSYMSVERLSTYNIQNLDMIDLVCAYSKKWHYKQN